LVPEGDATSRSLTDGSGGLALLRGDTMTEFQRLQHLVRLLADMTEEQRRALADFLNAIGWPPAENDEETPLADRPMTSDT
jgi:hypothetical protein